MKIIKNKEIVDYLNRIKINLDANYQNDYLDGYVDIKDELAAKKELMKAGQQEYEIDIDNPLFIESSEYYDNPYVKNIKLDVVSDKHFSYKLVTIDKGYLFNSDAIINDKDRELKDYMKLRALKEDIKAIFLYQDEKEWMMSVPSEFITNDPYAKKANGKVITFGLGIGYFVYMCLLNKEVESITVIEKEAEVINIFNKIKDQFPNIAKIRIIHGDAFDYFKEDYLKDFDYIYVDIYKSSDDGRYLIEKLLEQYLPPLDKCDFWIENSCLSIIKTLIYLYYDENVYHRHNKVYKEYLPLFNKVRNYFNKLDITVDEEDTLKDYMYNKQVIRKILASK